MDHDRLFKLLLRTFFIEFVQLFLPALAAYLDPDGVEFLDKEVFTNLADGERHEVDLVVRVRFRQPTPDGQTGAFFLIHVESQAWPQENFPRRMFLYFSVLHGEFGLPVYPIALFTYDAPFRPESDHYEVAFPDLKVLNFSFRAIQLNRLNWRDFLRRPNPVAAALMTKMRIAPEDRPRVKLECLRLIVTLKLDPARQALIREFMDSYLHLSESELKVYDQERKTLEPSEQEAVMQTLNEWELRGERRGAAEVVVALLTQRFGEVPGNLREGFKQLPLDRLKELAQASVNFTTLSEAARWVEESG